MKNVGNVGTFVLLKFENKLDVVISHINLFPKHHCKSKFALNFIQLESINFDNMYLGLGQK